MQMNNPTKLRYREMHHGCSYPSVRELSPERTSHQQQAAGHQVEAIAPVAVLREAITWSMIP